MPAEIYLDQTTQIQARLTDFLQSLTDLQNSLAADRQLSEEVLTKLPLLLTESEEVTFALPGQDVVFPTIAKLLREMNAEDRFSALGDRTSALEETTSSVVGRTTVLENRTDDSEERTTNLEGRASDLEERATSLEGRVTDLETGSLFVTNESLKRYVLIYS